MIIRDVKNKNSIKKWKYVVNLDLFSLFRVFWHDNIWSGGWGNVKIIESSLFTEAYWSSQICLFGLIFSVRSAIISDSSGDRLDRVNRESWSDRLNWVNCLDWAGRSLELRKTVWIESDDHLDWVDRMAQVRWSSRQPFDGSEVMGSSTVWPKRDDRFGDRSGDGTWPSRRRLFDVRWFGSGSFGRQEMTVQGIFEEKGGESWVDCLTERRRSFVRSEVTV
jgi:hypothetical protein